MKFGSNTYARRQLCGRGRRRLIDKTWQGEEDQENFSEGERVINADNHTAFSEAEMPGAEGTQPKRSH